MRRFILQTVILLMVILASCAQTQDSAPSEVITPPAQSQTPADTGFPSDAPAAEVSAEASSEPSVELAVKPDMTVSSSGISDGMIADAFGMRGEQQQNSVPTRSLPLSVKDAPKETACYAVVMLDPDSKPLCGYEWVHWLAAGFTESELSENASIDNAASMVQGKNDFGTTGYGGPTPPDKPHTYQITVYALDTDPGLKSGFSLDDLLSAMDGHVLAQAMLEAKYGN